MTITQIIAQMRRIVKVDTSQYSDANALIDVNRIKDELWSAILTSNFELLLNYQIWTVDITVVNQSEYTIPTISYNTAGTKIVTGVSIAYKTDTYIQTGKLKYIPVKEVNLQWLERDWSWYEENQREDEPIYFRADNSIFVAPVPRIAITGGIRIRGIRKIPDYTLSTTEAEIMLPVDIQSTLVYGLCVSWHENKWSEESLIINSENRYDKKRMEAIKGLDTTDDEVTYFTYPE